MHSFRDAISLHQFLHTCDSELHVLFQAQLDALAAFDGIPVGDLVNFFVLGIEDSMDTLDSALSRSLVNTFVESCVSHTDWFELVIIVSDGGFGYVVFIPNHIADQALLNFCIAQAAHTQENSR